jgi:CMP-N-acetylneuraminic acid synthetase
MKSLDDIAVVVQARLSSERVPGKMLRPFAGTTLIDLALEKLTRLASVGRAQCRLAVHEAELARAGERHGIPVFHRSARSARSEGSPMTELYEWWDRLPYSYVVLLNACCPFVRVETIDRFIRAYAESSKDGAFGVVAKRNYFWDADGRLLVDRPAEGAVMNTKTVGLVYEAAHVLYGSRLASIGNGVWMGPLDDPERLALVEMPEGEAFDIDHPWQFDLAERLHRAGFRGAATAGGGA